MTHLKLTVIGTLLLGAAAPTAIASDYVVGRGGVIGGGMKDYRNAVPVPAPKPAPSPERDWYVRGDLGFNFYAGDDSEDKLFGGIGFGRYITPSLRADLTMNFKHSDDHNFVGLANIYWDFERHSAFKPYLGLGVGGASFDADDQNGSRFGLAVSATAGVTIDIMPAIKLDSGYQFLWSDSKATDGDDDHIIRTGLRIDLSP
ncbi:MAG: porin family protein [Verrucomicrobiae bacterium]|nr:porin family protein [Verrucomicrobiae bacterium]